MVRILQILPEATRGIIVFSLPFIAGQVFGSRSISFTYLCGQFLLWAVFQIIAVPMVFFRAEFGTLFWAYTGAVVVMTAVGFYIMLKDRRIAVAAKDAARKKRKTRWKGLSPFLIIALLIIGYQMFVYIFGMHLDEDDARWIAEANDALVTNRMLLYNPATGEYFGRFVGEMVKDVFSPWSMYLAWLSRMTSIKAVVIAHTLYPPILLGLSYSAYYEMGCQLFKRAFERGLFILMVAVINLFMAGNAYTQSVFTLTRIWQGKAVVAAVIIPTILMVAIGLQANGATGGKPIKPARHGNAVNWLLLIVVGTASCLLSGMGIAIGLLMIAVYGLYAEGVAIAQNRKVGLSRLPLWLLSMAPGILYCLGYLCLKP